MHPTSLYRRLDDPACDKWLTLGMIGDWYLERSMDDEEKAVRWIRQAGKWPEDSGDSADWWVPHTLASRVSSMIPWDIFYNCKRNRNVNGRYYGPHRISAAILDLVRAWCRCVRAKRERVNQREQSPNGE